MNIVTESKDLYIGNKGCYPCGKEKVVQILKEMGRVLTDEAETIWEQEIENHRVFEIEISANIEVNQIPTLTLKKSMNLIPIKEVSNARNGYEKEKKASC